MRVGDEVIVYNHSVGIITKKIDDFTYAIGYHGSRWITDVNVKDIKPIVFEFKPGDSVRGEFGVGKVISKSYKFDGKWYEVHWNKFNRSWEISEDKLKPLHDFKFQISDVVKSMGAELRIIERERTPNGNWYTCVSESVYQAVPSWEKDAFRYPLSEAMLSTIPQQDVIPFVMF